MGIDMNGYCTQCRTYRGVPQAPQPPVSGTPYSGDPYSGGPYAGYQSSGPSFPDQQVSGPGYPGQTSGPGYPGQTSGPGYPGPVSGPPAFPPTTYGGQYGATPTPPRKNKFMMPLIALSGVVVVLVIAIVAVVALRKDDTKNVADPSRTTGASTGASAKTESKIDKCLVGTWQTSTYTETAAMDGVEGGVSISLTKNGSTLKFTPEGTLTETYQDSVFSGSPTIQGQKVPITITVNATVNSDIQTASGSIVYSNVKASGNTLTTAPSIGYSQTDAFEADDNPAKYTCNGDSLTFSTTQIQATAKRTSSG
ncbi:hypothetical protein AB0K00_02500 [Dactylosporangium sp. NPDC049525]|uniref:hypothetical protein n=1 Tax=Dactylosporangium sp. NPDC049525 TaxID=3154730 RepID=UPI0034395FD0